MKMRVGLLCLSLLLFASALAQEGHNWYEIFVRSYADSNGDGIGDIPGVQEKLDYIRWMGYDGIWLMPVMPSGSYHKYDVLDYENVDPEYGTIADMRALVDACHENGMRIIIDLPINHTGIAHPWFREACAALRAGDTGNPRVEYYHFTREGGQAKVQLTGTDWYYEEQFSGGGMPDLNLQNETVLTELKKIMKFWLCDMDVDGFRLDAVTSYVTGNISANIALLSWIKETSEALKPGSFLVGEAWTGLTEIARYYESGLDGFFLFPAAEAEGYIAKTLRSKKPAETYAGVLKSLKTIEGVPAPFLCNHDTGRSIGILQARKKPDVAKMAETLLSFLGGNTFTYYGEEIGMVGSGEDPNKRLAMYWNEENRTQQPPGVTDEEYAYPSVAEQKEDADSLLQYCRRLNELKHRFPVISEGQNEVIYAEGTELVMRKVAENGVFLVINLNRKEEMRYELREGLEAVDSLLMNSTEEIRMEENMVILPPYGVVILQETKEETTYNR